MLIEVNSAMWVNFEVTGQREWARMGADIEFMYNRTDWGQPTLRLLGLHSMMIK